MFFFQLSAILINTSLLRSVLLLLHHTVSHPGEQDVHVPSVELQGSLSRQFPLQLYWQLSPNVPFKQAMNNSKTVVIFRKYESYTSNEADINKFVRYMYLLFSPFSTDSYSPIVPFKKHPRIGVVNQLTFFYL